jgi:SOS-response transcriptional repressor LexA
MADNVRAELLESGNDECIDGFNIDEYLIDLPSRPVLLVARGDLMVDAGLLEGDTVIFKKGAPATLGDIRACRVPR